jgi:diguanylate cyclase (GGDEF)-like protein/PAS domain S-box-containing protein
MPPHGLLDRPVAVPGFSDARAFRAAAEGSTDVVVVTDAQLDRPGPYIRYVNPAFTRLTGWEREAVIGKSPRLLQGPGTDPATTAAVGAALRRGEKVAAKLLNYTRAGVPYWVDLHIAPLFDARGRIDGFAAVQRAVAMDAELPRATEEADARDRLTGLPLRDAFLRRSAAELAVREGSRVATAWIEIDGMDVLAARLGRPAAEAVVLGVADLLAENLRRTDLIGRLAAGGFGIGLAGVTQAEARPIAERLRRKLEHATLASPAGPLRVTASLGVAAAQPGDSAATLLARAEAAMAAAREGGGNRVSVA